MAVARVHFSLKELACERWTGLNGRNIADEYLIEPCREARNKVAHLVRMRKEDVSGVELADQLLKGEHIPVGSVGVEKGMLDSIGRGCRCPRGLSQNRGVLVADNGCFH